MHGRCHVDDGSKVRYKDDAIHVTCSVCDDLIAVIAVSEIELLYHAPQDEKPGLPLHGCCGAPAWATYRQGYVHITCTKCGSPLALCVVQDDRPPLARRAMFLRGGPT